MSATEIFATTDMCRYCFDAVRVRLGALQETQVQQPKFVNNSCPLFVTWYKKQQKNEYALRGCIGTFSEQPLHAGLWDYAITSAFEDSRFAPMASNELVLLKCSISLLVKFEPGKNVFDWSIGTHGIRISFVHPTSNKKMDATYLPQVCAEQGWNHEECLYSLYKKAGYKSQITKELLANTKLTRYQSVTCALTYDQYSKMSATTF